MVLRHLLKKPSSDCASLSGQCFDTFFQGSGEEGRDGRVGYAHIHHPGANADTSNILHEKQNRNTRIHSNRNINLPIFICPS